MPSIKCFLETEQKVSEQEPKQKLTLPFIPQMLAEELPTPMNRYASPTSCFNGTHSSSPFFGQRAFTPSYVPRSSIVPYLSPSSYNIQSSSGQIAMGLPMKKEPVTDFGSYYTRVMNSSHMFPTQIYVNGTSQTMLSPSNAQNVLYPPLN